MSDTMANVEIDDVLSSIRRLVSDGDKVKPGASPKDGRFVLTPAFRVFDDRESAARGPAVDAGSEVFRHAPINPELPVEPEPQETVLPDLPEVAPLDGGSPASEALEASKVQDAPAIGSGATDPAKQTEQAGPAAPPEPEPSAEFLAMEHAWQKELERMQARRVETGAGNKNNAANSDVGDALPTAVPPTTLEARIAELEAAVNRAGEDWEPDGTEPDVNRPLSPRIFEVVDNTQEMAPPAPDAQTPAPDAPVNDAPFTEAAEFEAPDPASAPGDPVFSHAEPRPYLLSDPTLSQKDAHEDAAKSPTPAPAKSVDDALSEPGFVSNRAEIVDDDDVYLDVDALREMITDVVREELRGRMGETITRNVRRMVRQEISRAIARYDPD